MVFLGSFPTWPIHTIIAISGIIITAAYILWTLQRMFFGDVKDPALKGLSMEELRKKFPEINNRELFTLIPLAIIIVFLGIWPHPVLNLMNASLVHLINLVQAAPGTMAGLM